MNIEKLLLPLSLKSLKRTGWVQKSIPDPESVADHSWHVAFLAMCLPLPKDVDRDRLVKMAILHDLAEVSVGDLVVWKGRDMNAALNEKKEKDEKKWFDEFFTGMQENKELAIEAIECNTPTGKYMKQLDRLDMALQACKYEIDTGKDLQTFFDSSDVAITDLDLRRIFDDVLKSRRGIQAKE